MCPMSRSRRPLSYATSPRSDSRAGARIVALSTWTEILAYFEQGSHGIIAGDGSEEMYKNICPGT